jgi:hypothetical protein
LLVIGRALETLRPITSSDCPRKQNRTVAASIDS